LAASLSCGLLADCHVTNVDDDARGEAASRMRIASTWGRIGSEKVMNWGQTTRENITT
jgi:hypothetical protein